MTRRRPPSEGVRRPTVLIVDDDVAATDILQDLLAHRGYATVAATRGDEALVLARSIRPALVISELYVPTAGCDCFTHAIRRESALRGLPLVAYTAHAFHHDAAWAAEAPVDAFLTKPTSPLHVAVVVEWLVGSGAPGRSDARA